MAGAGLPLGEEPPSPPPPTAALPAPFGLKFNHIVSKKWWDTGPRAGARSGMEGALPSPLSRPLVCPRWVRDPGAIKGPGLARSLCTAGRVFASRPAQGSTQEGGLDPLSRHGLCSPCARDPHQHTRWPRRSPYPHRRPRWPHWAPGGCPGSSTSTAGRRDSQDTPPSLLKQRPPQSPRPVSPLLPSARTLSAHSASEHDEPVLRSAR